MAEFSSASLFTPSLFHRIEADVATESIASDPTAPSVERPLPTELHEPIAHPQSDSYFAAALAPPPYDLADRKTVTACEFAASSDRPDCPEEAAPPAEVREIDLSAAGVEAEFVLATPSDPSDTVRSSARELASVPSPSLAAALTPDAPPVRV